MRAVLFSNSHDRQAFPGILDELWDSFDARDHSGRTVLGHAAGASRSNSYLGSPQDPDP